MLTIKLTAPDTYTAKEGGKELGSCRFAIEGDTLAITRAETLEGDGFLLDGLLRAALFYGYERGCAYGVIGEAVEEGFQRQLQALGLQAGVKLRQEDLPRHCGC